MKKMPSHHFRNILIILILFLLSGCYPFGASDDDPEAVPSASPNRIHITFWTPFSGGDGQFMSEMVQQFNEGQKEIRVDQLNMKFDDYYTRLQTAILSATAPDVAVLHSSRLPQFGPSGAISDLTDLAKQIGIDWSIFNSNILNSTMDNGKHLAVPLDTHALVLYYNKTYLRQAGLLDAQEKPIIDKGPEGFVRFLETIRQKTDNNIAPLAQPNLRIDAYWLWWALYNQIGNGGAYYDSNGKAAINNEAALKAMQFIHDLYSSELIPPNISDAFHLFQENKAALLITGMWGTGAFENTEGLDFGVVPLPTIFDVPATWGDSHVLALSKQLHADPERQKAALTFAYWLVMHGDMWAKAGHLPSVNAILDNDNFKKLPYRSDYKKSVEFVKYWPQHKKQWTINDEAIKVVQKLTYERQSPEKTLAEMEEAINLLLEER
jgi:multiple sugar transport system substrate-binding protein